MSALILIVFVAVYLGMASGRVPGLAIDRTGIALVGVIVLLLSGAMTVEDLPLALDWPTLLLIFALMIVAGHFAAAHCFFFIAEWITQFASKPRILLGLTVMSGGLLSVVMVNDIVVFALPPLLCTGLQQRGLDARPFLLALAGSANAGSAASLIGNPQNILIGEIGRLNFLEYLQVASVPAVVSLVIVYVVVAWVWRHSLAGQAGTCQATLPRSIEVDRWLTLKGLLATAVLIVLMITLSEHRVVAALAVAAVLMLGRKVRTQSLLHQVDGSLLVLIACLFVVTARLTALPGLPEVVAALQAHELLPYRLSVLIPFSVIASNTIGNVPAVVLLLQVLKDIPPEVLTALAVFSTLAGNLLLIGSLANIIVVERAARHGVRLSFAQFAQTGIPITVLSIGVAAMWFKGMGYLP